MTEAQLATFGILAGVFNSLGFIPYIRDILKGNTKPQRATYWIWFTVSVVAFFGQWAGGARWTLVWSFTALAGTGTVAVLSLKYGYKSFHRLDGLAILATIIGVALSLIFRSPLLAVVTAVLIDAIAASLLLHKTWLAPHTEHIWAWTISLTAATCGVLAVGHWQPAVYLAPLLNLAVNLLMVTFIIYRKPTHTSSTT